MSSKLGAIAAGEVIITGGAEVVATTMVGGIIAVTGDLISDHSDEAASVGGLFNFGGLISYLILAKHSFRRSSSKRTCASMASCNAAVPLLDNSAEAFLSRFSFQSRIACLVAVWASDAALRYVFMQASAIEHVLHS
jgi:hypothetical protein